MKCSTYHHCPWAWQDRKPSSTTSGKLTGFLVFDSKRIELMIGPLLFILFHNLLNEERKLTPDESTMLTKQPVKHYENNNGT